MGGCFEAGGHRKSRPSWQSGCGNSPENQTVCGIGVLRITAPFEWAPTDG